MKAYHKKLFNIGKFFIHSKVMIVNDLIIVPNKYFVVNQKNINIKNSIDAHNTIIQLKGKINFEYISFILYGGKCLSFFNSFLVLFFYLEIYGIKTDYHFYNDKNNELGSYKCLLEKTSLKYKISHKNKPYLLPNHQSYIKTLTREINNVKSLFIYLGKDKKNDTTSKYFIELNSNDLIESIKIVREITNANLKNIIYINSHDIKLSVLFFYLLKIEFNMYDDINIVLIEEDTYNFKILTENQLNIKKKKGYLTPDEY